MIDAYGFAIDDAFETPDTGIEPETKAQRLQDIRDYYQGDLFATEAADIRIDDAEPGWARVSMAIRPEVLNAKGSVMGGALYTMADFAASIADYEEGFVNMSVDSHMQFLRPAFGTTLIATAICTGRGRSIGYYRIRVEDDAGRPVATSTFTCMRKPVD